MALLYTALAAGAMGLVAAVATSNNEMRERVRESVGTDEQKVLEDCEQCVAFMREVGVEVPDELKAHPQINMCNKIALLPAEKLEAILRKFLSSDKIRKQKLAELAKSCRGEACAKIRSVSSKVVAEESEAVAEEKKSAENKTPEPSAEVSDTTVGAEKAPNLAPGNAEEELFDENPPSLTPAEEEIFRIAGRDEVESWKSVDYQWDSNSDVESQISGYSL